MFDVCFRTLEASFRPVARRGLKRKLYRLARRAAELEATGAELELAAMQRRYFDMPTFGVLET